MARIVFVVGAGLEQRPSNYIVQLWQSGTAGLFLVSHTNNSTTGTRVKYLLSAAAGLENRVLTNTVVHLSFNFILPLIFYIIICQ